MMIKFDLESTFLEAVNNVAKEKKLNAEDVVGLIGNEKINKTLDEVAKVIDKKLEEDKNEYLKEHLLDVRSFEERLYLTWPKPLIRLEMIIVMCRELGSEIYKWHIANACGNIKLDVIAKLHAHSIQISCEILQLLKSGFADGAMARWRSLHECAVIARILSHGDEELAEKYEEHKYIDDYKFSKSYAEHSEVLLFEKLDDMSITSIKNKYDSLIKKYGESFSKENGWSYKLFNKKKISFYDLESFSGLDFLRPFYKFSSVRVHVNSKSVTYKLSLSLSYKHHNEEILLSGPSNEGLVDPLQCTSMSLIDTTKSLLSLNPNIDSLVSSKILSLWDDKLKSELIEASESLERKGSIK